MQLLEAGLCYYQSAYLCECQYLQICFVANKIIRPKPKPRIKWLSECGLDSMEEGYRETVEGQSSFLVVHVHSYSGRAGDRDISLFIIVVEGGALVRAD